MLGKLKICIIDFKNMAALDHTWRREVEAEVILISVGRYQLHRRESQIVLHVKKWLAIAHACSQKHF
jgi:hypothetical protein